MPLRLELQQSVPGLIDLSHVTPDRLASESVPSIERILIRAGGCPRPLAELFRVSGRGCEEIRLEGELDQVHSIGRGMRSGRIVAAGSVGPHSGAEMTGGQLEIEGNAGAYVGAEMRGGRIAVHGNAGDWTGAAWPGSRRGMNRGTILVRGSTGVGTGYRMRRGLLVVQGRCGLHPGWQMRAGTLVCLGNIEGNPDTIGFDMIRGSIVCPSLPSQSVSAFRNVAWQGEPSWFPLLASRLLELGIEAKDCRLTGGTWNLIPLNPLAQSRGELWVALGNRS